MNESTAQGVASQSVVPARAGAARLMSDARLGRRAADGDQRAFAAIFQRYHQDLYRYCVAILGDSQDAQDALQNTMVKVLAALPGEQREIRLKPWLYRIAHNEAIDLRRGQRPTETLDAEIPLVEAEPAQAIETRDRVRRLVGDIGMLPERQRGALVMRELGDLSFEQIGAAFGTSAAVARQTVYEARLGLQQMSEGREMDCAAVTKALSDGDGRLLRRRDMRAHLRNCQECCRFEDGLKDRQRDLAAIAPLPAVVAAGLMQGVIGGAGAGSAAAGAAGGGAAAGGGLAGAGAATGKTVAGSMLAKSAATVAAVAVVGVSAADRSGIVDVGLPGGGSGTTEKTAPAGTPAGSSQSSSEQTGSATTQGAAGAGKQSQLNAGKALGKPSKQSSKVNPGSQAAGRHGNPTHPTPNGNAEAKGRSEAHHEGRHGNGSPAPTPNHGQGNPNHGTGNPNHGKGHPNHGKGARNQGQGNSEGKGNSANQGHQAANSGRLNAGRSQGAGNSHGASHKAGAGPSPPKASPSKGSERKSGARTGGHKERKSGSARAGGKKSAGRGKAAAHPDETLP